MKLGLGITLGAFLIGILRRYGAVISLFGLVLIELFLGHFDLILHISSWKGTTTAGIGCLVNRWRVILRIPLILLALISLPRKCHE